MPYTGRLWRKVAGCLMLALYVLASPLAYADQAATLKAAFVLNFLKFIEYPSTGGSDTNGTWLIAIIGDDPLNTTLQGFLDRKLIQGHKIEVQIFATMTEWKRIHRPCRAVLLNPAALSDWDRIRSELSVSPVLTISATPGFCAKGGMLNLFEQENRIRFEANPAAAEQHGLKLRSELLKLAVIVTTKGERE